MNRVNRIHDADIVVVGAGVAGLSAATAAARSGRSVVVIEKSEIIGGTARFANGSIWIPNNDLAVNKGILHDETSNIRFLLSECWENFDAAEACCGVDSETYHRAERYVRMGAKVIRELTRERIQKFTQLNLIFKKIFFSPTDSIASASRALESKPSMINRDLNRAASSSWDYHWENPHNTVPYGKHIWSSVDLFATGKFFCRGLTKHFWHILCNLGSIRSFASLIDQVPKLMAKFWGFGHGLILVERFRRHLKRKGVRILTGHELVAVRTEQNRVVAIEVKTTKGQHLIWQVNGGLILASGCFSHQLKPGQGKQSMPVRSSCVVPTNNGDALRILDGLDVKIERCPKPLLAQSVFQLAVRWKGVSHEPVFFLYGDSFFVVDRYGRRVMNEKLNYHDRAQHHTDNPDRELLFLICDRRFKERNWGFGISLPFDQRYVICARSPEEIKVGIQSELAKFGSGFQLADDFASNLAESRETFNSYATAGKDLDFGRGDNAFDVVGFPRADQDNHCPSRTMHPLTGDEIFACIYCLSAFSTHGGLMCDVDSRLLKADGEPWKNAYAVGTCAASFLNGHYPSHGMSIGIGLVFGYLAGLHATGNNPPVN